MADDEVAPEIAAISTVHSALKDLEPDAQARVLSYVAQMLKIRSSEFRTDATGTSGQRDDAAGAVAVHADVSESRTEDDDELEGISPVARKWMARNGLNAKQMSNVFSLGVDEIDLIAKTVPGKNKKDRMHSVFLLKGVAAYLGGGAARFTHEQMKEACLHYDAFDAGNFAVYFKSLSSEVTGSKESGYTLTPRGLAAATEMVKKMTQVGKS